MSEYWCGKGPMEYYSVTKLTTKGRGKFCFCASVVPAQCHLDNNDNDTTTYVAIKVNVSGHSYLSVSSLNCTLTMEALNLPPSVST